MAAFASFVAAIALALGVVVATAPAAAADDVPCSGNLQILNTFRTADGNALGEVQLYTPSAGHHYAKLVKLGHTCGVGSEIGNHLRKCTQTTNTGSCTAVPNVGGIDNGWYAYYAGPTARRKAISSVAWTDAELEELSRSASVAGGRCLAEWSRTRRTSLVLHHPALLVER